MSRERRRSSARTPEAREDELAAAAYDLAERQILDGTASSQVITHFLKAGSRRERMELLEKQHNIELMEVRKAQIEGQARIEELYIGAIEAMRAYTGNSSPREFEPGED